MTNFHLIYKNKNLLLSGLVMLWLLACTSQVILPEKQTQPPLRPPTGQEAPIPAPVALPKTTEKSKEHIVISNPENKPEQKSFSPALPLDSVLNKSPLFFSQIKPKSQTLLPLSALARSPGQAGDKLAGGLFRIQLLTVADFEAAQDKKDSFSRILGKSVEVLFDAPFYKLRFGAFTTKRQAQEALMDVTELGLQGFVVME
jgi:hypothetical protein